MSKSLKASFIAIILLIAATYFYKTYFSKDKHDEVHYHAGFVVFENGKKVDFSGQKYMTVRPCEVKEDKSTPEEIQNDKGHLHGGVGEVVHVHASGAKWGDLFKNLSYDFNSSEVGAYIDGNPAGNILETPIVANQSLVIMVGLKDEKLLSEAVTKNRIAEVEKTSMECGN